MTTRPFYLLLLVSFLFSACELTERTRHETSQDTEVISPYVAAFTSGLIRHDADIEVRLNGKVLGGDHLSNDVLPGLLEFSPSVDGDTWVDGDVVRFRPADGWAYDKSYTCLIRVDKIDDKASPVQFSFYVKPPLVEISDVSYKPVTIDGAEYTTAVVLLRLEGLDKDADLSEWITVADLPDEATIRWGGYRYGDRYEVAVGPFRRGEEATAYRFELDGDAFDGHDTKTISLHIPAERQFSYVSTSVDDRNQSVTLNFSDDIDADVELAGIVRPEPAFKYKAHIDGHQLVIVPSKRLSGDYTLYLSDALKDDRHRVLHGGSRIAVSFSDPKPKIASVYNGVILPSAGDLTMAFKAVNLTGVRLRVIEVSQTNAHHLLQENSLSELRPMKHSGRQVVDRKVLFKSDKAININRWQRYTLDLTDYLDVKKGAMYQVILAMDPDLVDCDCPTDSTAIPRPTIDPPINPSDLPPYNVYTSYQPVRDWRRYNYQDREDPCKPTYYMEHSSYIVQTLMASDIGLIAKQSDPRQLDVVALSIDLAQPLSGVELTAYSYQHTVLGKGKTDSRGRAHLELTSDPFLLTAQHAGQTSYLRVDDGQANNMSLFEVSGVKRQKGIQAYVYGDRGVWRPGDTLFIHSVIRDEMDKLEADFPLVMEWYDPKGQRYTHQVRPMADQVIHDWRIHLPKDALTGRWKSILRVGSLSYTHTWRVETVQANRIKVAYDLPDRLPASGQLVAGSLTASWLHGSPAGGLEVEVEHLIYADMQPFERWQGYNFHDETRTFKATRQQWIKAAVDGAGRLPIKKPLEVDAAPGPMRVQFTTRVYEPGGRFSVDRQRFDLDTYDRYAGIKKFKGSGWGGSYRGSDDKSAMILLCDDTGQPVSGQVEIRIYDLDWRWWYHRRDHALADFIRNRHYDLRKKETIEVSASPAKYPLHLDQEHDYGWKVIVVKDVKSGHQTSATYNLGWGRHSQDKEASQVLEFSTDKDAYAVGEAVSVSLPGLHGGHLIASVESGSDVVWMETMEVDSSEGAFTFHVTPEMSPNAYIHLTYIQPHAATANDVPIRTYGILPLKVTDPRSHLHPQIALSEDWRPNEEVSITVSDSLGASCEYTIAIVDEGLLSLTGFATPDPWQAFHQRIALGVQTWDLYDDVIGAHAGEMTALLAMGGDGAVADVRDPKSNRFEPMVRFIGPFSMKSGEKRTHKIRLPNYVGEVRCMVLSATGRGYGHADRSQPIKQPLMVQTALPRTLSPGDEVQLPVTVFAMDDKIKKVKVELQTGTEIKLSSERAELTFDQPGEQVVYFDLKAEAYIGRDHVRVEATGHGETAYDETPIDIRPPNPRLYASEIYVVKPGAILDTVYPLLGLPGSRAARAEIHHRLSPMNGEHFKRLIRYPHGCLEQTMSRATPQLYLVELIDLSPDRQAEVDDHIRAAIDKLRRFRKANGSFNYWPGGNRYHSWADLNAGMFMIEAHRKGYDVPDDFLSSWINYHQVQAGSFQSRQIKDRDAWRLTVQAYRLYVLALAGEPEVGAMNRLREHALLDQDGTYFLAMAYQIIGRTDEATLLVQAAGSRALDPKQYRHYLGSSIRSAAIRLEALWRMNNLADAMEQTMDIIERMEQMTWLSTQSTSFALRAIGVSQQTSNDAPIVYAHRLDDTPWVRHDDPKDAQLIDLPTDGSHRLRVKNEDDESVLFVRVLTEGIPGTAEQPPAITNSRLNMKVRYTHLDGTSADLTQIERGEDLLVQIDLTSKAVWRKDNMALTYMLPSGWEVYNERLDISSKGTSTAGIDYQDIRDDRISSYFALKPNETKTIKHRVTPDFEGRYYLPVIYCEDMYDHRTRASEAGRWVTVKGS